MNVLILLLLLFFPAQQPNVHLGDNPQLYIDSYGDFSVKNDAIHFNNHPLILGMWKDDRVITIVSTNEVAFITFLPKDAKYTNAWSEFGKQIISFTSKEMALKFADYYSEVNTPTPDIREGSLELIQNGTQWTLSIGSLEKAAT